MIRDSYKLFPLTFALLTGWQVMNPNFLFPALFLVAFATNIHFVQAKDIRAEFELGFQGGDPEVEFAGVTDDLDTDTGLALGLGLWVDNAFHENLSLGLQYLRLQDSDYSETASATFLNATLTAFLDIDPEIDAFLVNAALRDNKGELFNAKFHPYIGGGIGFAKSSADISAGVTVTVNGTTFQATGSGDDSDTNFAGQVFLGGDYDITDRAYIGARGSYFLTDATLFSADVEFRNFSGLAVLGARF